MEMEMLCKHYERVAIYNSEEKTVLRNLYNNNLHLRNRLTFHDIHPSYPTQLYIVW